MTARVPVDVVQELRKTGVDARYIAEDFQLNVRYDGKDRFEFIGDPDIVALALATLELRVGRSQVPHEGLQTTLGKSVVLWTVYGEQGLILYNLLQDELQSLEVKYRVDVNAVHNADKTLKYVEIAGKQKYYKAINTILLDLIKICENIISSKSSIKVKPKQNSKKVNCFIKSIDSDKTVHCVFYDSKEAKCRRVEIYGRNKEAVTQTQQALEQELECRFDSNTFQASHKNEKQIDTGSTGPPSATWKLGNSEANASIKDKHKSFIIIDEEDKTKTPGHSIAGFSQADASVRHGILPDNKQSRSPGSTIKKGSTSQYVFEVGSLKVFVYKQSIVDITGMDAIVNAANERMTHGGGVAYYISKAAGKDMDDDCNKYIDKHGKIPVTENFISIPGQMKVKGIIHAVGPQWSHYRGKEHECARDLYLTIMKIMEAAEKKRYKKIALSAISTGTSIFGVPSKLCTEMYIKAFVDFGTKQSNGCLKEVHFIDILTEILETVETSHNEWVTDDTCLDFLNAYCYPSAPSYGEFESSASGVTKTTSSSRIVKFIRESKALHGARRFHYSINSTSEVIIYTGSLTELSDVDAILCTLRQDLHGASLANAIIDAGGSSYIKELDKMRRQKMEDGECFVLKGCGKLKAKHVCHVITRILFDTSEKSLQYLSETISNVFIAANSKQIKSLAMPLIGAGPGFRDNQFERLAMNLASLIQRLSTQKGQKQCLRELHLVNKDQTITAVIQNEFRKLSSSENYTPSYSGHKRQDSRLKYGSDEKGEYEYMAYDKPNTDEGWIVHHHIDEAYKPDKTKSDPEQKSTKTQDREKSTKIVETLSSRCFYCPDKPATETKTCGHAFCTDCFIPMKNNKPCLVCKHESIKKNEQGKSHIQEISKKCIDCPICMETSHSPLQLKCGHQFCEDCLEMLKKHKPQCPICGDIFGVVMGTQPDGQMFYKYNKRENLPGYDKDGTIEIFYDIPPGKQQSNHPDPGMPYKGTQRRGFLPDNKEGRTILGLLRIAFDRRLIFTIGESRTTGKKARITWSDIHHKTKAVGGPSNYGYPDPEYLIRVREELAVKGINDKHKSSDYSSVPSYGVFGNTASASSHDDDILDSDIYGSIKTTKPDMRGISDSDMYGSITTTKPDMRGTSDSDMYGSIRTTKPDEQGIADSDMYGSITTKKIDQGASYSSDEDDTQNDTFAIMLRCKRRRGGYSKSVQNARSRDEALKWRYMFKNDTRLQEFKQKIGTVCDLVDISIDSNVTEIECENAKPTVIEENVKRLVSVGTVDLRVKSFNIKMEQSRKVVDVLKTTCTDFSDKTVSVFIESTVCYLVCPAHVFENNMVVLQKTHEFISTLPSN